MSNEKPMSTKVRDMVLRIMERALYYNNAPTCQERTGDKPTFIVEFHGQVAKMCYTCFPDGQSLNWNGIVRMNAKQSCSVVRLYEYDDWTEERILKSLENVAADMEHHYNNWYIRQEAAPNE